MFLHEKFVEPSLKRGYSFRMKLAIRIIKIKLPKAFFGVIITSFSTVWILFWRANYKQPTTTAFIKTYILLKYYQKVHQFDLLSLEDKLYSIVVVVVVTKKCLTPMGRRENIEAVVKN